jgi:hypothetical protein
MDALLAWWGVWGQVVLVVLGGVAGLSLWIARGEGKQLAKLVTDLLINLSAQGWDSITEEQVRHIAGRVYDGAYNWAGPSWFRVIPWRLFIKREVVQTWAWQAWQNVHQWWDSNLAKAVLANGQMLRQIPSNLKL